MSSRGVVASFQLPAAFASSLHNSSVPLPDSDDNIDILPIGGEEGEDTGTTTDDDPATRTQRLITALLHMDESSIDFIEANNNKGTPRSPQHASSLALPLPMGDNDVAIDEEERVRQEHIARYSERVIQRADSPMQWPCLVRDRWSLWNDESLLASMDMADIRLIESNSVFGEYVAETFVLHRERNARAPALRRNPDAIFKVLKLPHVAGQVMRVAINFLISYHFATRSSRSGLIDNNMASLLRGSLTDVWNAFALAMDDIVPGTSASQQGLTYALLDAIFFCIYPNALASGKKRLVRAIVDFTADMAMAAPTAECASVLRRLMPSLETTAADVLLLLRDKQQWLMEQTYSDLPRGLKRSTIDNGDWPVPLDAFDGGAKMAVDPLESSVTLQRYLAGPRRAVMLWPASTSTVEAAHDIADSEFTLSRQALRVASISGPGVHGDFQEKAQGAVRSVVRTPLGMLTAPENRSLLPLCVCSTVERAQRVGELKNEDRWWLTNVVKDSMGGSEVDIEDLVLGFSTLCRRNFGIKQQNHVRAQAARHAVLLDEQRLNNRPLVVTTACAAMLTPTFAYTSRRASACPFAAQNAQSLTRSNVNELLQWQLGAKGVDALGTERVEEILSAVDELNPQRGCLAHYNAMSVARHGTKTPMRDKKLVYPVHFIQFQAMRDQEGKA